jgi:hypothetical protein
MPTPVDGSTLGSYINCGEVNSATNTLSGLDHLDTNSVGIFVNGLYLNEQTVSNGTVNFSTYYSKGCIGLGYNADLETLNVELGLNDGTLQGIKIKIGSSTFRLVDTQGGSIGPNEDSLYEAFTQEAFELSYGIILEDTEMFTGDIRVPLGAGYENGGRIFYRQSEPLPVTISSIMPEVLPGKTTR